MVQPGFHLVTTSFTVGDVPYSDEELTALEEELLSRKQELEKDIPAMLHTKTELTSSLRTLESEIQKAHLAAYNELNSLMAEIHQLTIQRFTTTAEIESDVADDDPSLTDKVFKEYLEFTRKHNASLEKATTASKSKNPKAKELYRKIANKAHPDKTTNKRKLVLFQLAKAAYAEGDLDTLKILYNCLLSNTSWTYVKLKKDIEVLTKKRQDLSIAITMIVQSSLFQVLTVKQTDPYGFDTRMAIRSYVQTQLQDARDRVEALRPKTDVANTSFSNLLQDMYDQLQNGRF